MSRINYLNNRDILKEIHKSKTSYCSYVKPEYSDYDLIIPASKSGNPDLAKINKKNILAGRKARAERLARVAYEAAIATGVKRKLEEFEISFRTIPATDVVFRVMTYEHIPLDDAKTKKARMRALEIEDDEDPLLTEYDEEDKTHNKYVKINFPPFYHYKLDEGGVPYIVGKSHWQGGMKTGKFICDHGNLTPKLAHMFLKLCERYATRGNWRGYTYNDEMRSQALLQLIYIGLKFDESKSANPFAYYTAAVTNSFTRVLNIEKRNQNLRDDILEMNNLSPSYSRQFQNTGASHSGGNDE